MNFCRVVHLVIVPEYVHTGEKANTQQINGCFLVCQ